MKSFQKRSPDQEVSEIETIRHQINILTQEPHKMITNHTFKEDNQN